MTSENELSGEPEIEKTQGFALDGNPALEADEPAGLDDEPAEPDEQTQAEIEAARASLRPTAIRRKYKSPRSIPLMILIVGLVMAMGIYGIIWAMRLRDSNERGELRVLEEREVMSHAQQAYKAMRYPPGSDISPPGFVYQPLSQQEKARLDLLLPQFGTQFKPDEHEQIVLAEIKRMEAATQPSATRP